MDDLKISHVDPKVVDDVIELLKSEVGNEAPLTISRGKVHEYLGMTIDFSVKGKVKLTMMKHIENMLTELPVDMSGTVRSPRASHLFDVNDDAENLNAELPDFFITVWPSFCFCASAPGQIYKPQSRFCAPG